MMDMEEKPLILVAEDDSSNFRYLDVLLRRSYQIMWAKNGEEAVNMAIENEPALVLLDVKMPKMTGLEALVEIKKVKPDLPVIMQTAFAFDTDKEKAKNAGADGYLTKPISPQSLLDTIESILK